MNLEVPPIFNMSSKFSSPLVPLTSHYLNSAKFSVPAIYLSLFPNVEVSLTNLDTLTTFIFFYLDKFIKSDKF